MSLRTKKAWIHGTVTFIAVAAGIATHYFMKG